MQSVKNAGYVTKNASYVTTKFSVKNAASKKLLHNLSSFHTLFFDANFLRFLSNHSISFDTEWDYNLFPIFPCNEFFRHFCTYLGLKKQHGQRAKSNTAALSCILCRTQTPAQLLLLLFTVNVSNQRNWIYEAPKWMIQSISHQTSVVHNMEHAKCPAIVSQSNSLILSYRLLCRWNVEKPAFVVLQKCRRQTVDVNSQPVGAQNNGCRQHSSVICHGILYWHQIDGDQRKWRSNASGECFHSRHHVRSNFQILFRTHVVNGRISSSNRCPLACATTFRMKGFSS